MEFIWNIKALNVLPTYKGYKDVVYSILWMVMGKDGEYSATTEGALLTDIENIGLFIDYKSLTKDQVLYWVSESLTAEEKANVEEQITKLIEAQKTAINVVTEQKLPWSN
jgi:hypothetical protein